MLKKLTTSAIFLVTLGYISNASAYYLIYSPYVEYGETEVELYGHNVNDNASAMDDTQQYVVEIARGITPSLSLELKAEISNTPVNGTNTDAIALEGIYQLSEQGEWWLDVGLYAEAVYELENDEIEEYEFGPILARDFGDTTLTTNIIAEYEKDESKIESKINLKWAWRYMSQLQPAIEAYTTEYEKLAGPVISGKIKYSDTKYGYEIGWLTALDKNSPDNIVKCTLEYEF
jgi:hypothetical protein